MPKCSYRDSILHRIKIIRTMYDYLILTKDLYTYYTNPFSNECTTEQTAVSIVEHRDLTSGQRQFSQLILVIRLQFTEMCSSI